MAEPLTRILHVDDDEDIRTITKMTLELIGGYEVHQCSSGPEAIATAPRVRPQLFLLDMMMPEMNGEETWQHIAALPGMADIPAVFMTAKAERQFAESLLEKGVTAVILKPFEPNELCQKIAEVWQNRTSASA